MMMIIMLHLAQIVDQPGQMEPGLVRVLFTDFLGSLERMDAVGHVQIWIRLVHNVVEQIQGLHDGGFEVVKLEPFVLLQATKYALWMV